MFESAGFNAQINSRYEIGYEFFWKKQVFKSKVSTITKSIDHFIELEDGSIGSIELFILLKRPHVLVKKYDVIKSNNHLYEIQTNNNVQLVDYSTIRRKLIYLKFVYSKVSYIEVVSIEPNSFEGN